jgi:hypothetical protein
LASTRSFRPLFSCPNDSIENRSRVSLASPAGSKPHRLLSSPCAAAPVVPAPPLQTPPIPSLLHQLAERLLLGTSRLIPRGRVSLQTKIPHRNLFVRPHKRGEFGSSVSIEMAYRGPTPAKPGEECLPSISRSEPAPGNLVESGWECL